MDEKYERFRDGLLMITLDMAVPMWVEDLRRTPVDDRLELARECCDQIAAHGDALLYGGKGCAETFNALAKGIAALSFCPGGVTFNGRHWETRPRRRKRRTTDEEQAA